MGTVTYRVEGLAMTVETPHGLVSVQGTCFRVAVGERYHQETDKPDALAVVVHDGRVILEHTGGRLILGPGENGKVEDPDDPPQFAVEEDPGECPIADFLLAESGLHGDPSAATSGGEDRPDGSPSEPGQPPDPIGDLILEGQVLDPDGLPAKGAQVTISTRPVRKTTTGRDGSFSFDRMISRKCQLSARRGNLFGGSVTHQLSANSDPVVIRLRAASRLRVEVRDAATGMPVPGAEVKIHAYQKRTGVTRVDGSVLFEGVVGGGTIIVRADGYVQYNQSFSVPVSSELPIKRKVLLKHGITLSGKVLAPDGAGVAGAKVQLFERNSISQTPYLNPSTYSRAQGHYSFNAVAPGSYRLVARHSHYAPGSAGPVELGARRPVRGLAVQVGDAARIRGRVVDSTGKPVAWANIRYMPPRKNPGAMACAVGGSATGGCYADQRGRFEIGGLPRAKLGLVAIAEGSFSEEVIVDLGANPDPEGIELMVRPGGRIAGTVVDQNGKPQAEVTVAAFGDLEDGTYQRTRMLGVQFDAQTDGAGNFDLSGLVDGTYKLQASRQTGRIDWSRINATKAHTGDEDLRLVLRPYGSIRGRVQFSDGTSPAKFVVGLGLEWEPGVPFESADGRFEIKDVAPAKFDLNVKGPDFALHTVTDVEVEPGKVTDLGLVVVDRGRLITGRVIDQADKPVAGAMVLYGQRLVGDGASLQTPNVGEELQEGTLTAFSGPDGRFEIGGVGPAGGLVVAEHDPLGRSLPALVKKGTKDVNVVLVIHASGSITGQVRQDGKPAAGVFVEVRPKDTRAQQLLVRADPEGKYLFSRIAAGDHIVAVRLDSYAIKSPYHRRVAKVRPGEQLRVDFDIHKGDIELSVQISGRGDAKVDAAAILLIRGRIQANTGAELRHLVRNSDHVAHSLFCQAGETCILTGLAPGEHTLCAQQVTGDIKDREFIERFLAHTEKMKAYCFVLPITDQKQQTHVLQLPRMEDLTQAD